ncbi:hypothetical protein IF1G_01029 [Cordyceps javanica]|uniref:Uncharacterized protein n=1 Tax=Cordyceps javanica TaxID=43265 RepID=A0A545VH89_9HYPO|nr:hypothetical protein IF1G_01029 [Cordyceps javanica]TQW12259.1 hypothetical protein IF2G_00990 [Cordyceps javanica]
MADFLPCTSLPCLHTGNTVAYPAVDLLTVIKGPFRAFARKYIFYMLRRHACPSWLAGPAPRLCCSILIIVAIIIIFLPL